MRKIYLRLRIRGVNPAIERTARKGHAELPPTPAHRLTDGRLHVRLEWGQVLGGMWGRSGVRGLLAGARGAGYEEREEEGPHAATAMNWAKVRPSYFRQRKSRETNIGSYCPFSTW